MEITQEVVDKIRAGKFTAQEAKQLRRYLIKLHDTGDKAVFWDHYRGISIELPTDRITIGVGKNRGEQWFSAFVIDWPDNDYIPFNGKQSNLPDPIVESDTYF